VDDLRRGYRIQADSVATLLELEDQMIQGCKNLKQLLEVMASFGGETEHEV
jgi:hypothetical protein